MNDIGPGHDGTPVRFGDIANWIRSILPITCAVMLLTVTLGVAQYLLTADRFTTRIDFSTQANPLSPAYIREVSTNFLNESLGDGIIFAVTDSGWSLHRSHSSEVEARSDLPLLQDAIVQLGEYLTNSAVTRYDSIKSDLAELPDNAAAYGQFYTFRNYVEARESGALNAIRVQNSVVSRDTYSLTSFLLSYAGIGLILGALVASSMVGSTRNRA